MAKISNFKVQKSSTNEQTSEAKHQKSNLKSQISNDATRPFDLGERTIRFSEDIIVFCKSVQTDHVTRPLISQLVRSATSIGANLAEANNAVSKKDFRNKTYISKKEAQETKYWLRILKSCYTKNVEQLNTLWQEAHELTLILQAILNKTEQGMSK